MKLMKSLLLSSLAALSFSMNPALAYENKAQQAVFKQINDTVNIDVVARSMVVDKNGQALEVFKYAITNKSKAPIRGVHWVAVYTHNREVLYSQDVQLDFEKPLNAGKEVTINLQVPFNIIPEKSRAVLLDSNAQIQMFAVDRRVILNNGQALVER